jgi:succinyl-diaminopimelate desuccinylase
MNSAKILQHIDAQAIARDTLDFVQVKSETGDEGEGSAFLADLLRREGFAVEVEEVEPGRPNVYALVEGTKKDSERTLLFNGHTDTIPIGQSAPPGRDGDWIIGRGSEDMKGGLVAMVHGCAALRRAGVQLQGNLWMTGVVGHETPAGKKEGPKRLIEHLRSGRMPAHGILIVEGPCAIWAASLGSTIFTVKISTERGPIHTIKVPYEENPALWAGKLLTEFQQLERAFSKAPNHPLCGRELINVGLVHGGDYFNRLPTSIAVTGTRRWTPGKTLEDVRAELQGVCDRLATASGLSFELELEGFREPFETPADHALVRALQAAGQEVAGQTPELVGMGLVGDANLYVNDGGVATVYYGPAHETAHSDHERVAVSQLAHCGQVYALAAMDFCGVAE